MGIIPKSKPQITREELFERNDVKYIALNAGVSLVGLRGYYRDTMGKLGVNDRGIYDDAMVLVGPHFFATYNANTDPSYAYRKGLAMLKTGLWTYKIGTHGLSKPRAQQYQALVQAAKVTVHRDGGGDDVGYFGVNIHRGGSNTTSSLGCQTIVPAQWPSFIANVKDQMARANQKTIPYLLTLA